MFWKIIKWTLILFAVILIGIGIFALVDYFFFLKMNPSFVQKAEANLNNGISIGDAKNDFVIMGTNKEEVNSTDTNNPSPYEIAYSDIKEVKISSDGKYIYCKIIFWETIPKHAPTIEGDILRDIGVKLNVVDRKMYDQIVLHFDSVWEPVIDIPMLNTSYDYGPTGIEWPEDKRMSKHGDDSKVYGGAGTDYLLVAMPMAKINIKYGDKIYLNISQETRSAKFSHASVDVLGRGSEEKMGAMIEWKVGDSVHNIVKQDY